jgi:hypothetical protein
MHVWADNKHTMAQPKIEAHRITKPIQLLAVWFSALVLIDSAFLVAAAKIEYPSWVGPMLSIAAVAFVPLFLIAAFLMQTLFRPQLQDDSHYSEWLKRREKVFKGFVPENKPPKKTKVVDLANTKAIATVPEETRVQTYAEQKGLFLVHDWRPSEVPGQVADIIIWLHQHQDGPLSDGTVDRVEYHLGPRYFDHPVVKRNASEAFRLEVSAYAPMLCLAQVFLKGEQKPIVLTRYIDFEILPELAGGANGSQPLQPETNRTQASR